MVDGEAEGMDVGEAWVFVCLFVCGIAGFVVGRTRQN